MIGTLWPSNEQVATAVAPWRPDPRPLGALLQGIYAHLGVARFWEVQRRQVSAVDALAAHVEFVLWRDGTWQACRELTDAPGLTSAGRVFVGKLLAQLELLRTESSPEMACRLAGLLMLDQNVSWRLRNLEVDTQAARRQAEAWLSGSEPDELPSGHVRRRGVPRKISNERRRLFYRSLRGMTAKDTEGISDADQNFIQGDYSAARDAYEMSVVKDPADLEAWAGLALATAACEGTASTALTDRPELVAEIYQQAASAAPEPGTPRQLAKWLRS